MVGRYNTRITQPNTNLEYADFVPQLAFFFMLKPFFVNNLNGDVEPILPVLATVHDTELSRSEHFVRENLIDLKEFEKFMQTHLQRLINGEST